MPLNPPITDWNGRRVWIVGASTGIGRALAARLHALGARVAVSARSAPALQAFASACPGALALPLDATDREAMRQARAQIAQAFGGLDVAVYCAGVYTPTCATDFDLDEALRQTQINYTGALVMLDAVLPGLIAARGGHISLVSSVSGYRGLPRALAYGPTKAALINLAESMWFDLTDLGIGVSVICPGYVDTPATRQNTYRMPALISAEEAADHIVEGWRSGRFHLHFPKRFTGWLKLVRHLGDRAYFKVVRRATGL
jgi:NAD(P)-dependent dehydrogenase (short-subunit alcohol dehydrogenase family)